MTAGDRSTGYYEARNGWELELWDESDEGLVKYLRGVSSLGIAMFKMVSTK